MRNMDYKIEKLLHEGFSMKTLNTFTPNQIDVLYYRVINEQTSGAVLNIPSSDSTSIQDAKTKKQKFVTYEKELDEKALSKKQQKFFGVVRGMQKGDIPKKGKAGDAADDMKTKDVKDFASTKHKGLPEKKKKETKENVKKIEESIMKLIESHLHPTTTKGELLNSIKKFNR